MDHFLNFLSFFLSRKKLFAFLAVLFFLGLGISVVYRGAFETPKRTDFTVYLAAAEAVNGGGDIYTVQNARGWNYLYLPLLAVLLSFVTALPLPLLVLGWYGLSLGALYGSVVLLARSFPENKNAMLIAVAAYALALPCFVHTLARGQIGVLVLFLLAAAFFFYVEKKDLRAGLLLSLAAVLKVTPVGFAVFFFIFKKEWRVLGGFLAGVALFVFAVPSLRLGFGRNWYFLGEWMQMGAQAVSERPWESPVWAQALNAFVPDNQSFAALATRLRWGTENNFFSHADSLIRYGARIAAALGLGALAFSFPGRGREGRAALLAQYSFYPSLMLLVSPVSETHHFTTLFLSFAAALFLAEGRGRRAKGALYGGVWAAFAFYLAGLTCRYAGWYGLPALGLLFLCGTLWAAALKAGQKDLG